MFSFYCFFLLEQHMVTVFAHWVELFLSIKL